MKFLSHGQKNFDREFSELPKLHEFSNSQISEISLISEICGRVHF